MVKIIAAKYARKDIELIVRLAGDGIIIPVNERHYSLDKTAYAIRYLSYGHSMGKMVMRSVY